MSKFLKVIVNLFLVCAILIAGAILVPPLLGVSTTMVDSSSMDTNLPIGSVTYSQEVSVAEISVGDKILVESDAEAYAYIVESADASNRSCMVADANNAQAESREVALGNAALKIIITIPLIGYVMIAMRSVEGLIIIGLIVLFVIILFILSELWKKSDEDEDDEDDGDEDDEEDEEPEWEEPVIRTAEPVKAESEEKITVQKESAEPTTELTMEELARSIAELQDVKTESEVIQTDVSESAEPEEETEGLDLSDAEEESEGECNSFVPVARPTKEEILRKAKAVGEEPEIIEYEDMGVTIIDYSDLL